MLVVVELRVLEFESPVLADTYTHTRHNTVEVPVTGKRIPSHMNYSPLYVKRS